MTATRFRSWQLFLAFSAQAAPVLVAFFEGAQMKLKQDSMAVIASGTLVELFARVLPSIIERHMDNSIAPARRLLLRSE